MSYWNNTPQNNSRQSGGNANNASRSDTSADTSRTEPTASHQATRPTPATDSAADPASKPEPSGIRLTRSILILVVILSLGAGYFGGSIGAQNARTSLPVSNTLAKPGGENAKAEPPSETLAKVASQVTPSVVSISVLGNTGTEAGSGVILREDGTILTNNHVVADSIGFGSTIRVKFFDGSSSDARLVGRDPSSDLAVIKANVASNLQPAQLGSSASLHVGDTVLAIGSPLGLEGTVTSGIVSSLHRNVDLGGGSNPFSPQSQDNSLLDAIQTDAAINPGNSGGALVNLAGEVVGINTAIASMSSGYGSQGGNIGLGFAIPVDTARNVAESLMAGTTPQRAVLGVSISQSSQGVFVAGVVSGGPAEKAGIKADDIITKIDDVDVRTEDALLARIRSHKPGDTVRISYLRGGALNSVDVQLGSAA